ncbi:MAG: hypothetical protein JWM80_4527 [Cyanobacteria bacterium RYN_339]|nr:hypothetical protein [Cyanobacteria bacterium RYN_339]
MHGILEDVAQLIAGHRLTWTLEQEDLFEHPEGPEPAYYRVWTAGKIRLRERVIAGEGNPRDGWGWSFFFELRFEPGFDVSLVSGAHDLTVYPHECWIRGGTLAQVAAINARLAAG